MLPEVIPIVLLFLRIVLTSAQTGNDVQQGSQLPDGKICLFTCSEWIFEEKIQPFAPSADLLGPGYLTKHTIGFSNDDGNAQSGKDAPLEYQPVWGAVYSINENECDNVLKQSQSEYSVPFRSNEDVFVVKYQEMNCLVVDLGIQPGDHPPWRSFHMKIPNPIQDDAYFNRLAQIGVPPEYIQGLRGSSLHPGYHPIIPQDYRVRDNNSYTPKRTYDQLPPAPIHPDPHQRGTVIDNQPVTGQIPETHDREIPGLILPNSAVPTTQIQPSKRLLPGVVNPGSQPQDILTGVPEQYQGNSPLNTVQPGSHDLQVAVPKEIEPVTPDHQPVVVITPMKLPGSSEVKPVVAQPVVDVPDQSQVLIPDDGTVVIPSQGPLMTTHQPSQLDHTVPAIVTGVAHPPATISGTGQQPVDDDSYVVITPLSTSGIESPPVGHDYVVHTPHSLQPDDYDQQTPIPTTLGNSSNGPKIPPPLLFNGPSPQTQVGPVVYRQPPGQDHLLLTPDVTATPRLQTNPLVQPENALVPDENSGLLTLSPQPDMNIPLQNDTPLLTLNNDMIQPGSSLVTTPGVVNPNQPVSLAQSPNKSSSSSPNIDYGATRIPASFGVPMPAPVIEDKPMFDLNQSNQRNPGIVQGIPTAPSNVLEPVPILSDKPMFILDQSNPNLVSHEVTPNTINLDHNPDLTQTNTAPNRLPIQPTGDHTVHQIPASFGVPMPAPVIEDKPMFGVTQSNQPSYGIPTSSPNVLTPTPILSDKPMFTLDQSGPDLLPHQQGNVNLDNPSLLLPNTAPNHMYLQPTSADQTIHPISTPTSYQLNPNSLDLNNNPDLLRTNTVPPNLVHQPNDCHTLHPIPASFGIPKPTPVVQDNPMFGFDQTIPASTIPPNDEVADLPAFVRDEPMFTLDNSPIPASVQQMPNSFDNSNPVLLSPQSGNPALTSTIPDSHTVQIPTPVVNNGQPVTLASNPNNIPLTSTVPDTHTVQLPTPVVNNGQPVTLTTNPNNIPLTSTVPESHTVQLATPVVNDGQPITVTSYPDDIPLTSTVPDSHTVQLPTPVVNNGQPVTLASNPNSIPLTSTVPDSHTVQLPTPVVNNGQPVTLASNPNNIPLTSTVPDSHTVQLPTPVVNNGMAAQPTNIPLTVSAPQSVIQQPASTVGPSQTHNISAQPVQYLSPPPAYTPSNFMAPNYTPVSPALGYTFAFRYPQYLQNCRYKPPNTYYQPDELIPGFTFGSHIQLYD